MGLLDAPDQSGIIFDLDGTLVDTLADLTQAVNHAVEESCAAPWTQDQIRPMLGEGLSALIALASGMEPGDRLERMIELFRGYYPDHLLDETRLYPGVSTLLKQLAARRVRLAVLSNKPDDFTRRIVESLLGGVPFVCVRGMTESAPPKPDPTSALVICEAMALPVDRDVFVGDSVIDLETARRCGMRSVAATWGYCEREALIAARPDAVIDHPAQLLALDLSHIDR